MNENEMQELRFQVGEAWKGAYNSNTEYGNANVVQDPVGLSVYRSKKPGNAGHPLSDTEWWFKIISLDDIADLRDQMKADDQTAQEHEATRQSNETSRQTAETSRRDAENIRVQNESERSSSESERKQAETTRVNNETTRQSNETTRQSNETTRQSNETTRQSNETDRRTDETQRVLNEEGRVVAEQTRVENENGRVAAETAREEQSSSDHTQAESDHTRAEEDHNTATSDHNTASSDHTQAGTDHNTAVSDHNTASSDHTKAASDHTRAEEDHTASAAAIAAATEAAAGANALQENLENGTVIPALAGNLKNWEDRESLSVESQMTEVVRTTAGDESIESNKGSRLLSIIPSSDFGATALRTTGFNLLRNAVAVGTGYYFLVPALPFGTYGTAQKPNGVLFTDSEGNNLTPTVYFKPLSQGVPTGVTDGSACAYTDSHSLRFYNTPSAGYIIVSNITAASTCAHVAWSGRYNEYKAINDAGDAGGTLNLTSLFNLVHDGLGKLLYVDFDVYDEVNGKTEGSIRWIRRVGRVKPNWITVADEVEEGTEQTYTHTAEISGILPDGKARLEGGDMLTVGGVKVSYQDTSGTATEEYVKYQLATVATGTVESSNLALEDWGLEILEGLTGSAKVTLAYAQGYPDGTAAIAQFRMKEAEENVSGLWKNEENIEEAVTDASSVADYSSIPNLCGQPMKLFCNGSPAEARVPDNWKQLADGGYNWNGTPSALGQEYIDYSVNSGGHYTAVRDGANGLKWINS